MFSPLRNRFGIPGVISVIALVFAMFGGAYAASNDSGGGKATASAKGKQGPRGKRGKPGPPGPAGPVGPAGAQGPAGAKGDTGAAGSNGKNGTSVTNTAEPKGANCKEGGTKLVGTSTTYTCNGEKGAAGPKGDPWTVDGTLPPGKTETGAWAFGEVTEGSAPFGGFGVLRFPISFSIPLAAELGDTKVHYVNLAGEEIKNISGTEKEPSTVCTGSVADPTAAAGHLCVYEGILVTAKLSNPAIRKLDSSEASGASTAGGVLAVQNPAAEATGWGTWAVTAEE